MTAKVVQYARTNRKRLAETARWPARCATPRASCPVGSGGSDRVAGAGGSDGAGAAGPAGVEGVAWDVRGIRAGDSVSPFASAALLSRSGLPFGRRPPRAVALFHRCEP